jgi:abortive infection bacteriophage resistance protein
MTRVFSKPSLNLDQQIAHLRDNGMAIPDEERARYWLTHVSYYRLLAIFRAPEG